MKIREWLKENWVFVGIILFTIGIRIYYFFLTKGQTLWYDEAVYLLIAERFGGGITYAFGPVRPILFSLIISPFLSFGEVVPRVFILLMSVLSVVGVYYLGKEMYGKTTAIISSIFMSVFYLPLFFSYRLLVDLPGMTFFIFSALFFYKYCKEKIPKHLYIATVILAIGTLFKLSTAFILVPFLITVLMVFKFEIFKRKETWISIILFLVILAPYIIWGYFEFGGFVLTQAAGHVAPESYLSQGWNNLKGYILNLPTYVSWWVLVPFIMGISLMFMKDGRNVKRDIYAILLLLLPLIIISLTINHLEDRYILTAFPALFLIAGSFLGAAYNSIKSLPGHTKVVGISLIILLVGFVTYDQIHSADVLIKDKLTSYADVKQAGLWLKDNSNQSDIVATRSQPQIRYYSGLQTVGLPPTKEEFESQLTPDLRFYMISIFESHPDWTYNYPLEKNLTVDIGYITPDQKTTLVIYELK